MSTKLYLAVLIPMMGLASCQRQQIGGFMPSHHEPVARATPRAVTPPAESAQPASVAPETAEASPASPVEVPALTASAAEKLVAAAKGTKYERRVAQLTTVLEKATVTQKTSGAVQKMTFVEKTVSKMVLKKINKQITKEKKGESTQALNRDIKIGLILAIAGLILLLIPGLRVPGIVALVVGGVFIVIGLINQA